MSSLQRALRRNWFRPCSRAVDTGGSNQRSIRFAGRGLDDNNFTYDGFDVTNIVSQPQQPFVRLAIPTDAIEEFRIRFHAEFNGVALFVACWLTSIRLGPEVRDIAREPVSALAFQPRAASQNHPEREEAWL